MTEQIQTDISPEGIYRTANGKEIDLKEFKGKIDHAKIVTKLKDGQLISEYLDICRLSGKDFIP